MSEAENLTSFLEYVVKKLVEYPEEVKVEAKKQERNLVLRLKVSPQDRGRIIGKQGKMVKALRRLVNAISQTEQRVALEILE